MTGTYVSTFVLAQCLNDCAIGRAPICHENYIVFLIAKMDRKNKDKKALCGVRWHDRANIPGFPGLNTRT